MKIPKQAPLFGTLDTVPQIVEIPYETGELHYRLSRKISADNMGWLNEGPFEEYYKNGCLALKGFFLNGAKNGYWKEYYESGLPAAEGYYNHSEKCGTWTYYDKDGTLKEKKYYN